MRYPGRAASRLSNNGRKWTTRDSQEYTRAEIWGSWFRVPRNLHSIGEFDGTNHWTNVPSEKPYSSGHETWHFEFPFFSMQLKTVVTDIPTSWSQYSIRQKSPFRQTIESWSAKIEELLVDIQDIFARHRFDIGINEEFNVTPKDESPDYNQRLPAPINLKEDILVELAKLNKYGIILTWSFSKYASQLASYLRRRGQIGNSDSWLTCEKSTT